MTIPTTNNQGEKMCWTCGKSHEQLTREGVLPRHPFNDGTANTSETFGRKLPDGSRTAPGGVNAPATVEQMSWPFDPVLRQALVDKGVLTVEDLKDAEGKIRMITGQFQESKDVEK